MSQIKIDPKKEKIIVELDQDGQARKKPVTTPPPNTMGMLPTYLPPYIRRQRPGKKKKGFLRIFDLDLLREDVDSEYEERDISVLPPLNDFIFGVNIPLYRSQILDNINAVLDIPIADWTTRFREVTDVIDKYRLQVKFNTDPYQDITEDDTEGVSFETITRLGIRNKNQTSKMFFDTGGAFASFDTGITARHKVTALPSFSAPSVTFNLSNKKDVLLFISPESISYSYSREVITHTESFGDWVDATPAHYIWSWGSCGVNLASPAEMQVKDFEDRRTQYYFNYFFSYWERALIFDETLRVETTDIPEQRHRIIAAMKLHSKARAYQTARITTGQTKTARPTVTGLSPSSIALCNWIYGINPYTTSGITNTEGAISPNAIPLPTSPASSLQHFGAVGKLAAVLKQGENTYYIWEVTNF